MKKTYWIDVREADEFAGGHIEGSVNIPYEQIEARITEITADKNADIRVYCRSGRRSEVAKNVLIGAGYLQVVNEGGLTDVGLA